MSTHYAYTLSGSTKKFESNLWTGASNAYGYSNIPDSSTGEYIISSYAGYQEDSTGQYTLTTNYGGELLTTYFAASELYYHEFVTYYSNSRYIEIKCIAYNLVDGNSLPSYLSMVTPILNVGTVSYFLSTYRYIPYGKWGYNSITKSYGFLQPGPPPIAYDVALTTFMYNDYDHSTGEIFTYKNNYSISVYFDTVVGSYNNNYNIKYCPTYPEEVEEGSYIVTLTTNYGTLPIRPGQQNMAKHKNYYLLYTPKTLTTYYLGIDLIVPSLDSDYWTDGNIYPGSFAAIDPSGDVPYAGINSEYNNKLPILNISIQGQYGQGKYEYTNTQWQSIKSLTKATLSSFTINAWNCNNSSLTLTSVKKSVNSVDFYVIVTNKYTNVKKAIKIDSSNITWTITS